MRSPSRRALLGGLLLFALRDAVAAGRRIAALDWVSAQNLMALGVAPLAMPEIELYRRVVVQPDPGPQTRELGLRAEPNFELLVSLAPQLQVYSSEMLALQPLLSRISPTLRFDPYPPGGAPDPFLAGRDALLRLGAQLGLQDTAQAYAQACMADIDQGRRLLQGYDGRPLYVATVLDGRRMLVFGRGSLFQSVLDRYGITNAWDGPVSRFGHLTVSVDQLLRQPEARLLAVGTDRPEYLARALAAPVIASLPFSRAGRVAIIPNVLFYGGLPPARRFAQLVARALAPGAAPSPLLPGGRP
ncbi:ABC transporter substrate-binding protein [Bordetella ansorpii]|uniref:ABC transporter substrate-binding protein n=1 Tax=Bordetella ansorpii TaxID=288768 RepID=UPI001C4699C1|nr:ABC transporter substrate-binding protein [Bordetella ansorpii]